MALSALSSSASTTHERKYDVFLSFRGEDTRFNFISHLYAAFCRKSIRVFIDDAFSATLLEAIENSKISIVVFSKNYASSRWCLEELVKILKCRKTNGQFVFPVFYNVDPSDVRKQSGSFKEAFVRHEKQLQEDDRKSKVARWRAALTEVANLSGWNASVIRHEKQLQEDDGKSKVEKWRAALTEAANLPGWDASVIRPESKLVDLIVKEVLKQLNYLSPSSDSEDLVGLNSRIQQVKSLLCIGMSDFRIIGIWGVGGIGKTTIAAAIFNQTSDQFEASSFMENVREKSKKCNGLVRLHEELHSKILEEECQNLGTPNLPQFINDRLRPKKVLIVLDEVKNPNHLKFLVGGLDQFGRGSRIIITSRDKQVFRNFAVSEDHIYKVEGINHHEALKLFCNHALKQNHPTKDFQLLSYEVVNYCKGNPLAVKVLGSSLYRKSKQEWESALSELRNIPNSEINDVMKISYDGLDEEEKNIFLDVACFLNGENKDYVVQILGNCEFSLSVLVDKSLITISDNKIQMHDLLQDMGREIVRKESYKKPGNRSRLWKREDIICTLKNNNGTEAVQGIMLDMSKIEDIFLSCQAFDRMYNLRFLKFYDQTQCFGDSGHKSKVHYPYGLNYLPDELRTLHWQAYPLRVLPSNFSPENLVELKLPYSNLERLWEGAKPAPELRWLNLSHSRYLTEIPDLVDFPVLEVINLEYCTNLLGIPRSIQQLYYLTILSLKGCKKFTCFPSNIHFGSFMISLDLSHCINLTEFPQISGNMRKLYLSGTAIEEVPSSIENLAKLVEFYLVKCTRLKYLSTNICKLKYLEMLNLLDCYKLESFPEISETMGSLKYLNLSGTAVKEIPPSIENLKGLSQLLLDCCENLMTLPSGICNLESLIELHLSDCSNLDNLPENLGELKYLKVLSAKGSAISQLPSSLTGSKKLERLDCSECINLTFLPASVLLSSLRKLSLKDCNLKKIPGDIGCLSSLEILELCGNAFETLPKSIKQLSKLRKLKLNKCSMLRSITKLPLGLQHLEARKCKQLQSLPDASQFEELVTELCIHGDPFFMRLVFTNCLKLNQKSLYDIFAELQLIIRRMAMKSLTCCEKGCEKAVDVSICVPGSDIPEWFPNQNQGSSIDIQLSLLNWGDSKFMGFALCAVVAIEENYDDCHGLYINYKCHFETNDGDKLDFFGSLPVCDNDTKTIESDHVILGYDLYSNVKLLMGNYTIGSFEFYPEKDYEKPVQGCKVNYCGVCPIYEKPKISVENTDQDFGETMIEDQGSDDEEVEQHPAIIPESKSMLLVNKFLLCYWFFRDKVVLVLLLCFICQLVVKFISQLR